MEEQGFITLHRKLLNWQWYQDNNVKALFIHLLLKANHKEGYIRGIKIDRGQHLTGINKLVYELGLSEQKIKTAISKLIKTNEITSKSTNKYRIITVLKYEEYQATNKQDNSLLTNKQQTNNKQITTNNNNNNKKNDNNDKKKYYDSLEINELFVEFLDIRKKLKAVNTERAINIQMNKLNKFDDNIKKQMLENSISNSWKSVYELKGNTKNKDDEVLDTSHL